MINELIKKLRKAADVLDDLLDQNPSHNGKAKRAIHKAIEKVTKKKKSKAKHWTQRPENKKRFAQWKKSMANGRRGKL
jgi:hypothetical protein